MPRRTNMKNAKLSLHILKFDALMSCESNEHVDLCMIIMLFLLCPFFIYKTLESGSSRSSMPVEQSVVWKWTSLGVQWESSQACMWQLLTMLLISIWSLTILLSIPSLYPLCPYISIWSSPPHGYLFCSSLAYSSINIIIWSILSLSATTTSMNPHWQISSRPRHDGNMKNTSRLWGAHDGKIQAILAHYDNIIPTIISVFWNLLFSPGIQMIIQQYVRLFQNLILLLAT